MTYSDFTEQAVNRFHTRRRNKLNRMLCPFFVAGYILALWYFVRTVFAS